MQTKKLGSHEVPYRLEETDLVLFLGYPASCCHSCYSRAHYIQWLVYIESIRYIAKKSAIRWRHTESTLLKMKKKMF